MMIPISNARDVLLDQNSGTLPNVQGAMLDYFQPMTFTQVAKSIGSFGKLVETPTSTHFLGVWQPFSARQLLIKPEGQRKWQWFMCHADPSLSLQPDEVITYQDVQYRVMSQTDYRLYGYVEYHLVDDYTGSGP